MGRPPDRTVFKVDKRLQDHIEKNWSGKVVDFELRVRTSFIYVDVEFFQADRQFDELEEDGLQPLMRLRYIGSDNEWEFACHSWAHGARGSYEPSFLMNGQPFGTPEECFDCAAFPWR